MMWAFYGLGAVCARGVGLNTAGTALFMSATILGGVALQWPLGRLSDLVDRRRVIVGTFLPTLIVCIGPFDVAVGRFQSMLADALFGGTCFALFPLCFAPTNQPPPTTTRLAAS